MENLIEILKEIHPEVDFHKNDKLVDDGIIDSFDIVTLISEINQEFDITIPVEEIIPDNFNSAQSLYAMIKRLQDD